MGDRTSSMAAIPWHNISTDRCRNLVDSMGRYQKKKWLLD